LGYFAATAFLQERPQASILALILASSSAWAAGIREAQALATKTALRRVRERFIERTS
jgi:hypothetical protein